MTKYSITKKIGFIAGPILFLTLLFFPATIINPVAQKVIALAAWMIIWWVTEAVAIPVTALLPMTVFPLLGVMDIDAVTSHYANPVVYLFFGGFVIAIALEKVGLHRRIALNIIRLTGTNANGIILGFMVATAALSMWISNTACTVIMLPIAASVIKLLAGDQDGFTENDQRFALSIMLGIAYAASIGGMATLIGTPPNTVMAAFVESEYGIRVSFAKWMAMGVLFAAVLLALNYFILVKWMYPNRLGKIAGSEDIIREELNKLGSLGRDEFVVLLLFATTALLWVLRTWLNGWFGWGLTDPGIGLLGALAMLTTPLVFSEGKFALEWKDAEKLPWGILLLFGGGLALAGGLTEAGLIALIGSSIAGQGFHVFWVIAVLVFVAVFLSELMSNVALVTIFSPMVAGLAIGLEAPVLHLLIPVTLAASCGFMLPMATPPNAIVFASGYVKIHQMAKVGLVLDVCSVLLLMGLAYWLVPVLF